MLKFLAEPSATNSPSASRKTPSPTPQNLTSTKKRRTPTAVRLTLFHTSEVCDRRPRNCSCKGHRRRLAPHRGARDAAAAPPPRPPPPPWAAARRRQAWQACRRGGPRRLAEWPRRGAGRGGDCRPQLRRAARVLASFSPVELCRARAVSRTWYACATRGLCGRRSRAAVRRAAAAHRAARRRSRTSTAASRSSHSGSSAARRGARRSSSAGPPATLRCAACSD